MVGQLEQVRSLYPWLRQLTPETDLASSMPSDTVTRRFILYCMYIINLLVTVSDGIEEAKSVSGVSCLSQGYNDLTCSSWPTMSLPGVQGHPLCYQRRNK